MQNRVILAIYFIVVAYLLAGMFSLAAAQDFAITVYAGRVTDARAGDVITGDFSFVDANLITGALAWTGKRFMNNALSLEVEGQVGKYFGDQTHWEFNLPIVVRWNKFPWNEWVDTSLAWGVGPSYATEVPKVEVALHGSSQQWLIYWFGEIKLGPPKTDWAISLRLHHRSTGWETVGKSGGSNTLAAGLSYRF